MSPHSNHSRRFSPENWERLIGEERQQFQDIAAFFEAVHPLPHQVWLDFGCGPGYFTLPLAQQVQKVIASDISEEMLSICRRRAGEAGLQNIDYLPVSKPQLPLPDATVDAILLANVFHELESPQDYLKEWFRILKPGGQVVVIDWKVMETEIGPPLEHRIPEQQVIDQFQQAGLEWKEQKAIYPFHYFLIFQKSQGAPEKSRSKIKGGQ